MTINWKLYICERCKRDFNFEIVPIHTVSINIKNNKGWKNVCHYCWLELAEERGKQAAKDSVKKAFKGRCSKRI